MNPMFVKKQGYIQAQNLTHADLECMYDALVYANKDKKAGEDPALDQLTLTIGNMAGAISEYDEVENEKIKIKAVTTIDLYGVTAEVVIGWIDAVARIQSSVLPEYAEDIADLLGMLRHIRLATRQEPKQDQSCIDEALKYLPVAMKHLRLAEAALILEKDRNKNQGGKHDDRV